MAEWPVFFQAVTFGLIVAFIALGIVGTFVPALPGVLLIWFAVLIYGLADGFAQLHWLTFTLITLITIVAGTSDLWLSLLGAKVTGASALALALGTLGSLIGFILGSFLIVGSLPGAILGYALGVYAGQYHKEQDGRAALKASLGGLAGWGVSTIIQLGLGIAILIIFALDVLSG